MVKPPSGQNHLHRQSIHTASLELNIDWTRVSGRNQD